ncbi:type III-B CRISPR module RAMP protein Cmr6 [Thermocladium modestius]|nr:type III-B CRISPR module RAMP protein Cmr6 [Thermocladium modestius]
MAVNPTQPTHDIMNQSTNAISYIRLKYVKSINEIITGGALSGRSINNSNYRELINERVKAIMKRLVGTYSCNSISNLVRDVNAHMDQVRDALIGLGYEKIIDSTFILTSRLAIGLSNPYMEALELGIAWDPIANLPYIPSTSLRGALESSPSAAPCLTALSPVNARKSPVEASPVVVLDSYPTYCPSGRGLLSIDIINPHYREVEGAISETDVSPTPLPFLTVSKGIGFRVVIMANRKRVKHKVMVKCKTDAPGDYIYAAQMGNECQGMCTAQVLIEALKGAFIKGLGAKTALGYGRFSTK